ncbi:putative plastid-lipid-associated protein 2, chloroplastic [Iris pallida]|uniref:Plastid-lipid-associated protein 2, chloroplastic n=1 Tax=Iris pallida TaxID=29817 RepID=A0AAX6IH02_IRIPA|nr:putative plastid-lipid-associated protein 2, chloroplastic [Iris pallida]
MAVAASCNFTIKTPQNYRSTSTMANSPDLRQLPMAIRKERSSGAPPEGAAALTLPRSRGWQRR